MAAVFGQMGKYSEVIKRSEEIIRLEDRWSSDRPSDRKIGAMFFKANALDALGNFDEAIKNYDQVITVQHDGRIFASAGTLYYRGRSKVKNGDIMGGLSDLKAAIMRNDKYRKLANNDKDFESIRNDAAFRSLVTKPLPFHFEGNHRN
jgi:tetratricopeptide (TPR) repeat protein